ncbi:hypothetical protein P7K49_023831, partial [Saguinus oedipus]
ESSPDRKHHVFNLQVPARHCKQTDALFPGPAVWGEQAQALQQLGTKAGRVGPQDPEGLLQDPGGASFPVRST